MVCYWEDHVCDSVSTRHHELLFQQHIMNLSISSQSLAEIAEKLSTQVKQQALYYERTKKLEFIVDEQEKTISKLKVEVMQMKKAGTVIQNFKQSQWHVQEFII